MPPVDPRTIHHGALNRAARSRYFALVLLAHIARPLAVNGFPPGPRDRLLLIRPDHLGDLLFTTPALDKLREHFPQAPISYLVGPWTEPLAARLPQVDEVLYCTFPWFSGRRRTSAWEPYSLLFKTARLLRHHHFSAAVNLRFDFWWGAALSYLAGIPYRVGYGTRDCRPFLSPAVPYSSGRHEVLQNLTLLDYLRHPLPTRQVIHRGGDIPGRLTFPVSAEDRAFARQLLVRLAIPENKPIVVIHPGTRAPIKRWPEGHFADLAAILTSRLGAHIVLTGTTAERPLAEAVALQSTVPVTIASGETTLGQLAALFEHAKLVVGVDSGPLHIAVALGRPTVHLFGPSDHIAFGPYGDPRLHAVVRAGLDCSPCYRLDWEPSALVAHSCMAAITVEHVLQAVEQVLEGVSLRENGQAGRTPAV